MSLENEDHHTVDQPAETNIRSKKELKITYTRDFLLSLSELDVSKKLPSGFDRSLLSEFEDAPGDRQKNSGGLSLHGYRRNEYGSSPPTRGESGNYSRGVQGRWDSRSSGRSDRDSDSQSDWDSESGRRFGNQSRRSWQVPEHDGLLGSGSFPRPSGYAAAGASASKFRANDQYQLNRSNEPYHPPRPYKAVPHSRRETNDSYNDETFGSSEVTSEDRAEEERKRRASFEMMRKEQHKAFQEKQKLNPEKRKDEFDISTLLEDSKDEPVTLNAPNSISDKSVLSSQTPASRPLVPPGFANAKERNIGTKTVTQPHALEAGNSEHDGSIFHTKGKNLPNGTFDNEEKQSAEQISLSQQHESINSHLPANNKSDNVQNLASGLEVIDKTVGTDSQSYKASNLLKAFEASKASEGIELDTEKVGDNKIVGEAQDQSSSILDKLFGSVLTVNTGGSNSLVEQHDSKADDMWSPHAAQSSKFAHWFLDEEKKQVDDISSGRPNDLLSLIVGGEKGAPQASDVKATRNILSNFHSQSPELIDRHLASNVTSVTNENSEHLSDANINNINKPSAVSAVLTCEDLEQSILSEISVSDATLLPPVQGVSSIDAKSELKKSNVDDHASQHLLSLLQKGTGLKDVAPFPSSDITSSDKQFNVEVANMDTALHGSSEANAENVSTSGKSLTLETLFGTAFMKELQSVGAPSSAQRGSVGSARIDALEMHDALLSSKAEVGSSRTNYESSILASNHREKTESGKIKEHLLGFDEHLTGIDSSQLRSNLESKLSGFDGPVDIRLPEEDSLITLGDPMRQHRNSSKAELFSTPAAPVDITEKLAALNSVFGDERPINGGQEGSPFLRGPYDVREPDVPLQNLHGQGSSPQLHPQINHVGPLFNPLDSHPANINSQMKFVAPENIIHHDPPATHQFPANMLRPPFHHPSTGLTGFDPPPHNHPMLQQMHVPGSFPPPHLLQGFPGGPRPNTQMTGFIQDINPMQGVPFGHRQPNFAGLGMQPPAPEVGGGSNNPEMLQRLIEMELRSNTKQIHPLAPASNQGMYNYELDMGFRYR